MERQTITVDIAPGNSQVERLGSSQGDIGRPMGVYIIQDGVALDCSAYSAELYILKPDGKFYTTQATVDATETNLIKWETALQETPVAGACAAQIRIASGDDDIGTARFVEFVEASPCDMGSASESEVALLTEYVRQARESATSAGRDATTASGAASSASGSASTATAAASTATQAASAASAAADRAEEVEESIPEDYSTLSEDVTGLKSDLSELHEDYFIEKSSVNLYDKNTCNPKDGKVYNSTGTALVDSASYAVTGKMPVQPNTQYIFSVGGLARIRYLVQFKGESGETFISETQIDGAAFTTGAETTYIDFELFAVSHTTEQFNAAISVAQLQLGGEATPYEPYGTTKKFSLPATSGDVDKALSPKTVENGKVTEWQYKEIGGGSQVTVDDALSDTSTNPVQNKVITGIVNAITEKNVSPNLYDKDTCNPRDNTVYNSSHQYMASTSYAVTGKMPVDPSTQYIFYAGQNVNIKYLAQWKGESGETFISETAINSAAFTTGPETTFVEFEIFARIHTSEEYTAAINTAMLVKGDTVPDVYQPYGQVDYVIPTESLEDGSALEGAKNCTVQRSLVNLYDKSQAEDNKVFNGSQGKTVGNNNYAYSGLVKVNPNSQYCFSVQKGLPYGYLSSWYQTFDANKIFIEETRGNQSTIFLNQIQTGATTEYISFNIYFDAAHTSEAFNAAIDTIMVVEGIQRPAEYVEYNVEPVINHDKFDDMYRENANRFRGKKWLAFGTSVTYQDSKAYTEGVAEGEVVRGYLGDIARRKPMIVTNQGISGSTLAGSDDGALINRYNTFSYTDYDFVTIEYGINDFGNNVPVGSASDAAGTGSFAACLKTIIEYILTQNPIIGLIICTDPDVRGTTLNANNNTLKDYADVTLEIAEQYRLPVCNWFYHSGINAITKGDGTSRNFLTQSGTHPSVYGHMRMGAMLNQVFDSLLC